MRTTKIVAVLLLLNIGFDAFGERPRMSPPLKACADAVQYVEGWSDLADEWQDYFDQQEMIIFELEEEKKAAVKEVSILKKALRKKTFKRK